MYLLSSCIDYKSKGLISGNTSLTNVRVTMKPPQLVNSFKIFWKRNYWAVFDFLGMTCAVIRLLIDRPLYLDAVNASSVLYLHQMSRHVWFLRNTSHGCGLANFPSEKAIRGCLTAAFSTTAQLYCVRRRWGRRRCWCVSVGWWVPSTIITDRKAKETHAADIWP